MGLLNWLKGNRVAAGTSFEVPVGGAIGELLGTGRMTPAQAFKFYRECQAVATVIDIIAESIADLPLFLEISGKVFDQHEILDFLNKPHDEYTGRLFKTTLATHFLLAGTGYVFAGGNFRNKPLQLAPISPRNVSPTKGGDGFVDNFVVSGMMYSGNYAKNRWLGRRVFLASPLMQLKQIRRFSTEDNSQIDGESKLAAAAMDVRQNLQGSKHNLKTLTKGGRLTLLFSIKDEMSSEKFQETKNMIMAQYSGDQGNSIGVVNANQIDVQEMGLNNRDMEFAALQGMTEKAIAKRYGVPLPLISDDAATYNNLATAYQALYDNASFPVCNQLLDGLGDLLFPRYKLDPSKARFRIDEAQIPAIAMRQAEIAEKKRKAGVYKDNEIRGDMGLAPIGDGDVIYRPANLLPGMQSNDEQPPPRVAGDE